MTRNGSVSPVQNIHPNPAKTSSYFDKTRKLAILKVYNRAYYVDRLVKLNILLVHVARNTIVSKTVSNNVDRVSFDGGKCRDRKGEIKVKRREGGERHVGLNDNVLEASQFLQEYNEQASDMCYRVKAAQWAYSTNLTEYNKAKMVTVL
ncbi:hypothetical protein J6590_042777 [Homalodisca vitripennis]|nr:hypothetical protein J6590_042777 [Homalodisca vitripennis]